MTRVVRNAALACAAGILVASAALANVPDPSQTVTTNLTGGSALSNVIIVEGNLANGRADSCEIVVSPNVPRCGKFQVTVKDFAGNLIAGSQVMIDFSGCPDISISCNQLTSFTGQTGSAGKKVSGVTDALGNFTFQVQGAANPNTLGNGNVTTAGTALGTACAQLYADGVPIKGLRVSSFDLNGAFGAVGQNKVNATDVSVQVREQLNCAANAANCKQRNDISMDAVVNATDNSRESAANLDVGAGTGSFSTGTYCP